MATEGTRETPGPRSAPSRAATVAALAAVVLVTGLARVPTMRVPLDQDCAVYTYAAQRWAEGGLPYRDVFDHKPPGIYLVYRLLFAVFSPSGQAVNVTLRVASLVTDAAAAIVLFFLARRLFGLWQGVAAGLLYALFAALPGLQYEALQPERLVTLFVAAGFLTAVVYMDRRRYWWAALSGLLFGLALVVKPIAAPAGIVVWAWVSWDAWRRERGGAVKRVVAHSVLLAVGAVLPWGLFAAYFAAKGALEEFWFCTYAYNALYATEQRRGGLLRSVQLLVRTKMFEHCFWWALGAAGVGVSLWQRGLRRGGVLAAGWLVAAFVGVYMPGQFAYYYYLPTGAPLALAGGVAVVALAGFVAGRRPLGLRVLVAGAAAVVLVGCLGLCALRQKGHLAWQAAPRTTNRVVARVAGYIAEHSEAGDRLYVWGSRPQLYVLSGRRGVCPYLFNFSHNVALEDAFLFRKEHRERIMAGLRRHEPGFIVATETRTLEGFPELARYLDEHYAFVRRWEAKPYAPTLYRRKDAS
ncbi:MAG: ArnT family glycosyltransferase [bacterium]